MKSKTQLQIKCKTFTVQLKIQNNKQSETKRTIKPKTQTDSWYLFLIIILISLFLFICSPVFPLCCVLHFSSVTEDFQNHKYQGALLTSVRICFLSELCVTYTPACLKMHHSEFRWSSRPDPHTCDNPCSLSTTFVLPSSLTPPVTCSYVSSLLLSVCHASSSIPSIFLTICFSIIKNCVVQFIAKVPSEFQWVTPSLCLSFLFKFTGKDNF